MNPCPNCQNPIPWTPAVDFKFGDLCAECWNVMLNALEGRRFKSSLYFPPNLGDALSMVTNMRLSGADYTDQEMRDAWLTFEAGKREDGRWMWGRTGTIPPGDPRAALESRMQDIRNRRSPVVEESKIFWMNKEKLALVQKEIDAIKAGASQDAFGKSYSPEQASRLKGLIAQKKELKVKLNL